MRTRTRPAAGFSLLELTIVIGIILLLAALVVAVSTAVIAANERRNTQNTLAVLDAAMKEWERQVDRPVTFQHAADEAGTWDVSFNPTIVELQIPPQVTPYNGNQPAKQQLRRMSRLIEVIAGQATAATVLARLPDDVLRRVRFRGPNATLVYYSDRAREVVDAWGNPIVAIFPGRARKPDDPASLGNDPDGTIRTVTESDALSCRNRQVLFVSFGPDGIFADNPSTVEVDESADNLYSYGEEVR